MDIQLIQNSLEQVQKKTLPLIGFEEKLFIEAVAKNKIKDLPEIDLRNALKFAMLKVGIRGKNFPEGIEKSVLLTHIYEHYGNHSPDEIRLAFDLAVSGKLELNFNEVNSYENFSCLYFSKIMNAYRVWAEQVYKQNIKPIAEIENKPDLEQIEKEYQEFLQTDLGKRLNPKI